MNAQSRIKSTLQILTSFSQLAIKKFYFHDKTSNKFFNTFHDEIVAKKGKQIIVQEEMFISSTKAHKMCTII